jgi:hypothetical protein
MKHFLGLIVAISQQNSLFFDQILPINQASPLFFSNQSVFFAPHQSIFCRHQDESFFGHFYRYIGTTKPLARLSI